MKKLKKSKLYEDEFKFIFDKNGSGVRRVTVISALIEEQIFSLVSIFLRERDINYKPAQSQKYKQSLNLLKTNKQIDPILEDIEDFNDTLRNKAIHGIFEMEREEWNKHNKKTIDIGRKIVKYLDEKLYPND